MTYVSGSAWGDCPGLGDGDVLVGSSKGGRKELKALIDEAEEAGADLKKLVADARKQKQAIKRLEREGGDGSSARVAVRGRTSVNWPLLLGGAAAAGGVYWMILRKKRRAARR